ncbi:hypothetical protein [Streptomyces sp. NPDC047525]|uniref:hypothetical protein n=1 Tax=Streptomyces sp. NPDC047525 TaxID=3155264 RepID=UPI0033C906F6
MSALRFKLLRTCRDRGNRMRNARRATREMHAERSKGKSLRIAEVLGTLVAVLTVASLAVALWPSGVWPRQEGELPSPKVKVESNIIASGVETRYYVSRPIDQLTAPVGAEACSEELGDWLESDSIRGVPIGDHIRAYLTSERPESMVITGINVKARKLDLPARTVATACEGGNGIVVRGASIVVDKIPFELQFYDEDAKEIDSLRINIGKGDAAEINLVVTVSTPGSVYEWTGEFEVLIGGEEASIPLRDGGKPFRVAGPPSREAKTWVHPDYR